MENTKKSPIKILLMIVIFLAVAYVAYYVYLQTFGGGNLRNYTQTPPECAEGYGYTVSMGPTDGYIYSPCRKGSNTSNYPQINF